MTYKFQDNVILHAKGKQQGAGRVDITEALHDETGIFV